jgi:curved DNA-binding protein CbpA
MIIAVTVLISCMHAVLAFNGMYRGSFIGQPQQSTTRLFRRVYHNDDGTFDITSAPKLDFNENYYRVLEVDSNCSQKDLKKAFLKMIFAHHPDRIGRDNEDYEEFILLRNQQTMVINAAYKAIKDDTLRLEYDKRHREPIRMKSNVDSGFGGKKASLSAEEIEKQRADKLLAEEQKKNKREEERLLKAQAAEAKKAAKARKGTQLA